MTVNNGSTFTPDAATVINSGGAVGTITGSGTVQVTRTAATADYSSQYKFTTNTLTNLTVEYKGTATQTVSALTYGYLKINNSSGVSLAGNTTVNGTLTLTSGKVTTTSSYTLTIGSSGSISGAGASSYIIGNLQKPIALGATSVTYEIGGTNYDPITVAFNNVTTAGTLTAKATAGQHPNLGKSIIPASKDVNLYWTLTGGGGLAFNNYNATFNFVAGDITGSADTSNFIVGNYSSSAWLYPTVGTKTTTSTQATGMTTLGDFAIGEKVVLIFTTQPGGTTPTRGVVPPG